MTPPRTLIGSLYHSRLLRHAWRRRMLFALLLATLAVPMLAMDELQAALPFILTLVLACALEGYGWRPPVGDRRGRA